MGTALNVIVPIILGVAVLLVVAMVSGFSSFLQRRKARRPREVVGPKILIHSINDERCTGCDACVAVCPTNVLDLVENKSRVLRFEDCIQCEACMWACPTTALVMHPENTEPPPIKQPDLDQFFQTRVPGQYLIGEVAGKPLVKNAANLGRAVVEHMTQEGLRSIGGDVVDVAIVGSGPGGLSAALSCVNKGLSYAIFDKEHIVASTIKRYPKGKLIMAEPYDSDNYSFLPVFDSSKEEMIPLWEDLTARVGIKIKLGEAVETVVKQPDGIFEVSTTQGRYRAQRVVLATGLRGKPRTLGVPGENNPKVQSLLEDPDDFRGQAVCVIGGGDSALEAAAALADAGAKVLLSYRGRSFNRAAPKNKQTIESYEAQRRIKVKYQSQIVEFSEDSITISLPDGSQKRYPNQSAFVLIGADPPVKWLSKLGIDYVERAHMHSTGQPDELVKSLVPSARLCPQTPTNAAALVNGETIEDEPAHTASASKRLIQSAGRVLSGVKKLEKPMPLAQFARESRRKHNGDGRRDELDPRERTRVLRMLRDEGGRLADEDSQLYQMDPIDFQNSVQRTEETNLGTQKRIAKGKRKKSGRRGVAPLTLPPGEPLAARAAPGPDPRGGQRAPSDLGGYKAAASEWDQGAPQHMDPSLPLSFEDSDVHEMTKLVDIRRVPAVGSSSEYQESEEDPTKAIDLVSIGKLPQKIASSVPRDKPAPSTLADVDWDLD